jgi:uncharacterized lipoprotein YddW (UPF0748 family)
MRIAAITRKWDQVPRGRTAVLLLVLPAVTACMTREAAWPDEPAPAEAEPPAAEPPAAELEPAVDMEMDGALLPLYTPAEAALPLPHLEREFRGVWIASVSNIDWPSRRTLTTAEQQAELIAMLDDAVRLNLNTVILQVRPAGDALYASALEPWSEYLTGEQGRSPSPYYDPLAFAVAEAHRRGLELHAWFNPFRARHPSARSTASASHISRRRPELVRTYGSHLWMDPSEPEVRAQALAVILDVVRRYDVDGVHIDDYFYPYQERDRRNRIIPFPDEPNYQRYRAAGGRLPRDDWRRSHVDTFVAAMYDAVKREKRWVKVGISPFGIWRPGYPASVRGLDAFADLYADARKWLNEGWLDYMVPQLYWQVAAPQQPYVDLLAWWVGENHHGRHMVSGLHPNRVGTGPRDWPTFEVLEQVRLTRANAGAVGNVHFSMQSLQANRVGLSDALRDQVYATRALVPATPWLGDATPAPPRISVESWDDDARIGIALEAVAERPAAWIVQQRTGEVWQTLVMPGGETQLWLDWHGDEAPDLVAVRAVSRTGVDGEATVLLRRGSILPARGY